MDKIAAQRQAKCCMMRTWERGPREIVTEQEHYCRRAIGVSVEIKMPQPKNAHKQIGVDNVNRP